MDAIRRCFTWLKQHWTWLKWPVALTLLGFLFSYNREGFGRLVERRINWTYFVFGFVLCGGSILLTFVRWYLLVWALEFPFRLRDAFRLGFIGYLFNYMGPGIVGGDLYKAGMIASEQKSRKTVAVATIVLDRLLGLLALFMVGATASLFQTTLIHSDVLKTIAVIFWVSSIAGLLGLAIVLLPGATNNRWVRSLADLPVVGRTVGNLLDGFSLYQSKPLVLILAVAISLVGHFGMLSSFYFCALALNTGQTVPDYFAHLLLISAAELAGMIPITPGGVGTLEVAVAYLYELTGAAFEDGFLTGLGYRAITILIAAIGGGYYFIARREIEEVLVESTEHQAPEAQEKKSDDADPPHAGRSAGA